VGTGFRKRSCASKKLKRDDDSKKSHRAAQERQLALFELKEDCRPAAERTPARRYAEPTLLDQMHDG
jgi:hypothetical protein